MFMTSTFRVPSAESIHFRDFSFRRRTPGPPPFSSMNSTSAASKTQCHAKVVIVALVAQR
jgi:hypothetical protein